MKIGDKIQITEDCHAGSVDWWKKGHIYEVTNCGETKEPNGRPYVYFSLKKKNGDTNGWDSRAVKYIVLGQEINCEIY